MTEHDCQTIADLLVDYADGQLPAAQARPVEQHLAGCPACRRQVEQLGRSLELAQELWQQQADRAAAAGQPGRSRGWRRRIVAIAAAAAVVIVAGAAMWLWLAAGPGVTAPTPGEGMVQTTGPAGVSLAANWQEAERSIFREERAARLAAAADILAAQPGGRELAADSYRYLAKNYSDTHSGRQARAAYPN